MSNFNSVNMKKIVLLFVFISFSCCNNENGLEQEIENCSGNYTTAGVLVNINENIFNSDESVNINSRYSWSSNGS